MKLNIDEEKYKVRKREGFIGNYSYDVVKRKRVCKVCNKAFDSNSKETLTWYDDDGFYRIAFFCKTDYIIAKRFLKTTEREGMN
tara:strand:+ start:321 stop:572 length:252 start_codon:yes stop_codon:yes gene_type:complete